MNDETADPGEPMPGTNPTAESLALVAKALGHPARLQIVELLAQQPECRGSDVFSELPLAQSTISEHLRILREAGIVTSSPSGTGALYCLTPAVLAGFAASVAALAATSSACTTKECR